MLQYQHAAMAHLKMVRLRDTDAGELPATEREIWDVILDAAVSIREAARRALTSHQTRHCSLRSRFEGLLVIVLAQFLELFELKCCFPLASFTG
jgi:hypothetical protein